MEFKEFSKLLSPLRLDIILNCGRKKQLPQKDVAKKFWMYFLVWKVITRQVLSIGMMRYNDDEDNVEVDLVLNCLWENKADSKSDYNRNFSLYHLVGKNILFQTIKNCCEWFFNIIFNFHGHNNKLLWWWRWFYENLIVYQNDKRINLKKHSCSILFYQCLVRLIRLSFW